MSIRATVSLVLISGAVGMAWLAVRAREAERSASAGRNRPLAERAEVGPRGQFDGLESVAPESLEYFAAHSSQELSDADLLRHTKALIQIGDQWLEQARYVDAKRAFKAAHQRVSALATRTSGETEAQLLRGRTEGAMALILRRQGEEAAARVWLARQRSTMGSMLGGIDGRAPWQQDIFQRQHELAERALGQAHSPEARENHLDELAARIRIPMTMPAAADVGLRPAARTDERSPPADR